ncbi:MAG: hypothetical protein R3A13_02955 [Bdellovibrionota bacterium]
MQYHDRSPSESPDFRGENRISNPPPSTTSTLPSPEQAKPAGDLAKAIVAASTSKQIIEIANQIQRLEIGKEVILRAIFLKLKHLDLHPPATTKDFKKQFSNKARKKLVEAAIYCCKPLTARKCITLKLEIESNSPKRLNLALDCVLAQSPLSAKDSFELEILAPVCKKMLKELSKSRGVLLSNAGTAHKLLETLYRQNDHSVELQQVFFRVWRLTADHQAERIGDPISKLRTAAAQYIVFIDQEAETEIYQKLGTFLKSNNSQLITETLRLLADAGEVAFHYLSEIVNLLKIDVLQTDCIKALGSIGERAGVFVPELILILDSPNNTLARWASFEALGKIGNKNFDVAEILTSHWDAIVCNYCEADTEQLPNYVFGELRAIATGITTLSVKNNACKNFVRYSLESLPRGIQTAILAGLSKAEDLSPFLENLAFLEGSSSIEIRLRTARCYYSIGSSGLSHLERMYSKESNPQIQRYISKRLAELRSYNSGL